MNDQRVTANELESVHRKPVIVTGGTTGIGRATALLLAREGARVLIFGRHDAELQARCETSSSTVKFAG